MTVLRTTAALAAVAIALIFAPGASAQELPGSPQVDLTVDVPAIQTDEVTVLGPNTAIVQLGIDPNNAQTLVHIEFGESVLLGQTSPKVLVAAGADPVQLVQELTGLRPGTSYHYKVVAENSNGSTSTATNTFQTAPATRVDPATGMPTTSGKGVSCTITGTAKGDKLKGTKKKDVICGLGGNDRINGGKGNDQIIGGTGNDRINGGAGKDKLLGNGGKDKLRGGAGNDNIKGGAGNDSMIGNGGRDKLAGGNGNDKMTANRDRKSGDRINGGKGRDRATVNRGDRVNRKKTERVNRKGGKTRKQKKRR